MSDSLACPECGSIEFEQNNLIKFNLDGDVVNEVRGTFCCNSCGWELSEEYGIPITDSEEIIAKFDSADEIVHAPMKKRTAPNWDDLFGKEIFILLFQYGRDEIDFRPFQGFCRGRGAITGDEQSYQESIGVYTDEGIYYNILIDTRVECGIPTFIIDRKPFFYPIVAFSTMCCGLPVIDPATGDMKQLQIGTNENHQH